MEDHLIEITEKFLDTLESVFDTMSQGHHHGLMCSIVAYRLGTWIEMASNPEELGENVEINIEKGREEFDTPTIN